MTSYITVATPSRNRYFDLDAVRTPYASGTLKQYAVTDASDPVNSQRPTKGDGPKEAVVGWQKEQKLTHAGAPPLDWFHETDATIDAALNPPRETYEGPPMSATFLVGDVYDRMAELPDHSFDLIITSPPFLALRSYLPDDHPQKHLELGSESTPADYLDVLLALTAEWRRLLAPHGSIAVELGDTYAGSGGAGGDYNDGGLHDGQAKFNGSSKYARTHDPDIGPPIPRVSGTRGAGGGNGWPLDKSLCGIPTLYTWSLAYGRNLLTGQPSPAGQWRIRNLKPWIRSNPPVGALGDKERPATSYITVATVSRDRWFDLDAVRTAGSDAYHPGKREWDRTNHNNISASTGTANPGGAPPLDWWHHVDAIIDHEINQRAGKTANARTAKRVDQQARSGKSAARDGNWGSLPELRETNGAVGARGVHIRRALERAGILTTLDALDVSPKGYAGAHYAVWPPELVRLLVDEMCPRRVCRECGEPSRRIVGAHRNKIGRETAPSNGVGNRMQDYSSHGDTTYTTLGWSDCGCPNQWECDFCKGRGDHPDFVRHAHSCHALDPTFSKIDHYRPGRILDPFVGSGTTLAVATGMGRDAVGIDLDPRNAHLAEQRCGMFLEVDWGHLEPTTELPPDEIVAAVNEELL